MEDKDDVKKILEQEEANTQPVAPAEQKTVTPLVNNTMANPYKDQQYLPGQTIGYGLPTDQKVINYDSSNVPKRDFRKLKRGFLILTILIVVLVAVYGFYFVARKITSS